MSARSSPSPGPGSPHPTLPPIIASEKDRNFLVSLNAYIDQELSKVDRHNPEQRYTVYKAAFDRIIDYVTAYKPLLTAIKAQYEDCIQTIERGQQEAFYLSGKLKAMSSEPSTIYNYKKRSDELEHKLDIIRGDNARLQKELQDLRAAREKREEKAREMAEPTKKKEVKRDNRIIPGLTLQQSTDVKTLTNKLEKVERQLRELGISHRTRYTPKDLKNDLKEQLSEKVVHRDHLVDHTAMLKERSQKLKVAVEAAHAYLKIQPPHQTIGDSVVRALARADKQFSMDRAEDGRGSPSHTFEEDDPNKEKEAEIMLEYIERFNELLEDHKYEEAAIHAANSPKGILRTPETLHRFQDLAHVPSPSGRTPLLAFCDALMSTVLAYGVRPSEYMSLECVKCALEENRLDLLSHWISQDRLTMTEQLGDRIYLYCQPMPNSRSKYLALAQQVYAEIECHMKAVICMVKQGRIKQALEYANHRAAFRLVEYMKVLNQCPGPQLAHALYQHKTGAGHSLLPLGLIVTTLLTTDAWEIGLHLLQDIYTYGPKTQGNDSSPLRQAVFDDMVTSHEDWLNVVQKCQDNGYNDVGIDILAAVTVISAVRSATQKTQDFVASQQQQEGHKEETQAEQQLDFEKDLSGIEEPPKSLNKTPEN